MSYTTGAMLGHDALNNPGADNPLRDIVTSYVPTRPKLSPTIKMLVENVAADCQVQHDPAYDDTRQSGR